MVNVAILSRRYRTSFDQRLRKSEAPAQFRFSRRHFAIVTFMIIPRQVQDAMQNQNAYFIGGRVPKAFRIPSGEIQRDCNVPSKTRNNCERSK